ncbi:MAG: hypothetical protein AUI10_10540 [Actinobacteria bacterium 13_2_20CM_2_72_6]|nr:MAG: hypothetical protein AUI10_10540 [Actinobacteria bacterium 13_2_20CM_2_72_6]
MSEWDPLAAEFAALDAAVLTRPPGVAAAERTVRRRRRTLAVASTSLAVALVGVLGVAVAGLAAPPRPVPPALPALSAAPDVPGWSPEPPVAPSAVQPTIRSSVPAGSPGNPGASCKRSGAVQLDLPQLTTVSVRVDPQGPYPLCPGERVRVFVATYSVDSKGTQALYRSQTSYLDAAHNPLTLGYQVPPCHAAIYVVSGGQAIRATIPALADFYKQAPSVYYSAAAGPYGGVVWVQEQNPCAGTNNPAGGGPN